MGLQHVRVHGARAACRREGSQECSGQDVPAETLPTPCLDCPFPCCTFPFASLPCGFFLWEMVSTRRGPRNHCALDRQLCPRLSPSAWSHRRKHFRPNRLPLVVLFSEGRALPCVQWLIEHEHVCFHQPGPHVPALPEPSVGSMWSVAFQSLQPQLVLLLAVL